MASPVVVSATESSENADVTTHDILRAAGVAGQLSIIIFAFDGGSNVVIDPDLEDNYTEFFRQNNGTGYGVAGFWRQEDGTEDTSTQFGTDDLEKSCSIAYSISGAADPAVDPPTATTNTGASSTAPDPPSITPPSSKDYLFITGFVYDGEEIDDDDWVNTSPTNYTPSPGRQITTGTGGATTINVALATAERALTTGSAENPGTFACDTAHTYAAFTIIVHPAAALAIAGYDVRMT